MLPHAGKPICDAGRLIRARRCAPCLVPAYPATIPLRRYGLPLRYRYHLYFRVPFPAGSVPTRNQHLPPAADLHLAITCEHLVHRPPAYFTAPPRRSYLLLFFYSFLFAPSSRVAPLPIAAAPSHLYNAAALRTDI